MRATVTFVTLSDWMAIAPVMYLDVKIMIKVTFLFHAIVIKLKRDQSLGN
jgi:hypothetical protein